VLRRSNGYFVDASSNYGDEPFIYKVGNTKKVIKGLDEAIRGMKARGVRRVNIPPKMAFVEGVGDDKPGPMPSGE
jgi:FKBP-type peptidyl-prolyl cis-trans isomerase